MVFGNFFAVVGVVAPAASHRTTIGIDQQIEPAALHLIEPRHQRFPPTAEVLISQVRRCQQQRSGADAQFAFSLLSECLQAAEQNVINRISQMETSVSGGMKQPEMSIGVDGLIMAMVENGELPATQIVCVGLHRRAVQQQSLPMHLHRPAGIRAEEQRILDQQQADRR